MEEVKEPTYNVNLFRVKSSCTTVRHDVQYLLENFQYLLYGTSYLDFVNLFFLDQQIKNWALDNSALHQKPFNQC